MLVNRVLGGDFNSRLMLRLREEEGLVYDISSALISWPGMGRLEISCSVAAEQIAEAMAAIEEEVSRLSKEGPTEAELRAAQNATAIAVGRSLQRLQSLSAPVSLSMSLGQPADHQARQLEESRAVTQAAAQAAAATLLRGGGGVWVVTGDQLIVEEAMGAGGYAPRRLRSGDSVTSGKQ